MTDSTWHTAEHGPLQALGKSLWQVEATVPLLPIGRRMVIARRGDGDLIVHNAVACDDSTMSAIQALGRIAYLVIPNGFHRMDLPAWAARYPDCKVIARPAASARIRQRGRVDGGPELIPADPHTRWIALDGVPSEGVLLHDTSDGIVAVFNDSFLNNPARLPGVAGAILRAIGSTGGPKVTPVARMLLVKQRNAYASHLRRLADMEPVLAVPGHGALLRDDVASALRAAAINLERR